MGKEFQTEELARANALMQELAWSGPVHILKNKLFSWRRVAGKWNMRLIRERDEPRMQSEKGLAGLCND